MKCAIRRQWGDGFAWFSNGTYSGEGCSGVSGSVGFQIKRLQTSVDSYLRKTKYSYPNPSTAPKMKNRTHNQAETYHSKQITPTCLERDSQTWQGGRALCRIVGCLKRHSNTHLLQLVGQECWWAEWIGPCTACLSAFWSKSRSSSICTHFTLENTRRIIRL